MTVAVIKSSGANLASLIQAIKKLHYNFIVTDNKTEIQQADKAILPGVGTARYAMEDLTSKNLVDYIKNYKKPLLGICLGMQILFEYSYEDNVTCLGIFQEKVKKIPFKKNYPVPHMGWNNLHISNFENLLTKKIKEKDYVYFVHSFYVPVSSHTLAWTDYSLQISALVAKDNFFGCQFHPEKSGKVGELILRNFLEMDLVKKN